MGESVQNYGGIKNLKRKRESNFPEPGKKIPGIFLPLRFLKIVTNVTKLLDYIKTKR
jgi:hypothetical protein